MLDTFFTQTKAGARMQSGPMGSYLPGVAAVLHGQGYANSTIRRHLHAAEQFGAWLLEQGISVANISTATINHYREGLDRQFSPSCPRGRLSHKASGVGQLLELLGKQGVLRADVNQEESIGVERWLEDFDHHLDQVAGNAAKTRSNFIRYARRFLTECYGNGEPDWLALRTEQITEFVRKESAKLQPSSCRQPVTAIRALLRY